ncbi:hypothetical protein [Curtobacterium pusillum]|uniref:hypothetical protein n=1 Tax=Curtobacterium pusillum TaxID=69373 RepID=UPI00119DA2C5|nr:hypothetical protein [Curtobacterium pusillum]
MQMVTDHVRWCATDDEQPVLAWCADRSTVGTGWCGRHLAPVAAVGRLPDGCLAVDVLRPSGTPLSAALDTIGTLTTGVAVTLSVPLLELAAAERSGAVHIGAATLDDVLVDDAGAVVLCDRPPAARLPGAPDPSARAPAGDAPSAPARHDPPAGRRAAVRGARVQPGDRILVLAARVVWERTDARDPDRQTVDGVLAEALDGDATSVRAALAVVRATAAPRPVRWEPPSDDLLGGYVAPVSSSTRSRRSMQSMRPDDGAVAFLTAVVRDAVERGLPVGADQRVPLRHVVVGLVVAAGLTVAAVSALG